MRPNVQPTVTVNLQKQLSMRSHPKSTTFIPNHLQTWSSSANDVHGQGRTPWDHHISHCAQPLLVARRLSMSQPITERRRRTKMEALMGLLLDVFAGHQLDVLRKQTDYDLAKYCGFAGAN